MLRCKKNHCSRLVPWQSLRILTKTWLINWASSMEKTILSSAKKVSVKGRPIRFQSPSKTSGAQLSSWTIMMRLTRILRRAASKYSQAVGVVAAACSRAHLRKVLFRRTPSRRAPSRGMRWNMACPYAINRSRGNKRRWVIRKAPKMWREERW